jgi:FixJ family two-component response regulator
MTPYRDEPLVRSKPSLVSVVDDDQALREALPDLLRQLPGMSGPDLQQELARRRQEIPVAFITGHGSGSVSESLLARGAVECLVKPFTEAALLEAVRAALRGPYSEFVTTT